MLQGTRRNENICHSKDGQIHMRQDFLTDWIGRIVMTNNNKTRKDQQLPSLC